MVWFTDDEPIMIDPSYPTIWFRKAADAGLALAQHNLGVFYAEGRGVPRNDAEAVVWYRKAAEQGNASPMNEGPRHKEAE